eukprot:Awhi_evm1s1237
MNKLGYQEDFPLPKNKIGDKIEVIEIIESNYGNNLYLQPSETLHINSNNDVGIFNYLGRNFDLRNDWSASKIKRCVTLAKYDYDYLRIISPAGSTKDTIADLTLELNAHSISLEAITFRGTFNHGSNYTYSLTVYG